MINLFKRLKRAIFFTPTKLSMTTREATLDILVTPDGNIHVAFGDYNEQQYAVI
jgi:hypothetical protein